MLVSFNGARKAGAGLLVMMLLCALWPVGAPGVAEAATSAAATVTVRVEGLKETKLPPTGDGGELGRHLGRQIRPVRDLLD